MSCCDIGVKVDIPEGSKAIVLAGNPNVGKSVFFNYLTGVYVDVSNFPGTTVDINHGKYHDDVVLDTPGVYGVSSFNDEERVARDVILNADIVLNVVDSLHMERDLFLTQQIIDMGKPVIVALNMMDEAEANGIYIDVAKLSEILGVKVIPTVAIKGKGLQEVAENLQNARTGKKTPGIDKYISDFMRQHPYVSEEDALMILEDDHYVAEEAGIDELPGLRDKIYSLRRNYINSMLKDVIYEDLSKATFVSRLSSWMIRPATGIPILLVVLGIMYYLLGVGIAQKLVGITEDYFMGGIVSPFIIDTVSRFVSPDSLIGTVLIGEFGLLTMTLNYVVGLLLPLVIGFYLFLSILEDSGYLPRIATLVDKALTGIGLNGKAIIPMILGFGCVTMATITTRILGTRRERVIATMLLGLAIPCSAQLGVIAGMISRVGPVYFFVYVFVISAVFAVVGYLLNKVLPGESSDLLLDLPTLRMPEPINVLKKTMAKSKTFITEATPLFAYGAIGLSVLKYFHILDYIIELIKPLTVGWLQLPKETATAFIMGFVRRDFGAAGLYAIPMTPKQVLVALITITLFVPCIAATMVIFKERSRNEGIFIWVGSLVIAFLVGGIVSHVII
ncbi:ferrous iron transport protein B [Calorimonas adulescens]|uniref:Ferrous iron transport protein B n=1 Tax=Calorimonas adulescens TaxID=2606906 RepID=A0A5D8QH18_9THEO|nr:ferrous iron transport protein B [Calorimonas adulescens]TZE83484.1 ferrous iron transport protein B [Calorimonas adulescens]